MAQSRRVVRRRSRTGYLTKNEQVHMKALRANAGTTETKISTIRASRLRLKAELCQLEADALLIDDQMARIYNDAHDRVAERREGKK